jgi:trans-aconitate methyltransferase
MEWRLFDEGTVPYFTTAEFFAGHPWIEPGNQIGHAERIAMVTAETLALLVAHPEIRSVSDLGCGDGSFLAGLPAGLPAWGYDAGLGNVEAAQAAGLDVRRADILTDPLHYGDLIVCTEVLEHLADPHAFVRRLPAGWLIATSPANETDTWHYEHHAWAWDRAGYRQLFEDAGWTVVVQVECESRVPYAHRPGRLQPIRFQALTAYKGGTDG